MFERKSGNLILDNIALSSFVKVLPDFEGTYLTVSDRL